MLALRAGRLGSTAFRPFCSSAGVPKLPPVITFQEFEQYRKKRSAMIIDVREPHELVDVGAVPGAVNIPGSGFEDSFALSPEEFASKHQIARPNLDAAIIAFCRKGVRSENARQLLMNKFHYTNVGNFVGSFTEWKQKMEQ